MSDIDRYDVEAMIRDAGYRYATRDDLHETAIDLRGAVAELRADIAELRDDISSLWRVLNSRTEHLA